MNIHKKIALVGLVALGTGAAHADCNQIEVSTGGITERAYEMYENGCKKARKAYAKLKEHKKEVAAGVASATTVAYVGYKLYRVLSKPSTAERAYALNTIVAGLLKEFKGDASKVAGVLGDATQWVQSYLPKWLGGKTPLLSRKSTAGVGPFAVIGKDEQEEVVRTGVIQSIKNLIGKAVEKTLANRISETA